MAFTKVNGKLDGKSEGVSVQDLEHLARFERGYGTRDMQFTEENGTIVEVFR